MFLSLCVCTLIHNCRPQCGAGRRKETLQQCDRLTKKAVVTFQQQLLNAASSYYFLNNVNKHQALFLAHILVVDSKSGASNKHHNCRTFTGSSE